MLIFLYGENSFFAKEKSRQLRDKFNHDVDPSGRSSEILDGEKTDINELTKKINETSLFSPKKILIIENIFSNKQKNILKSLLDILKNKKNENVIVFLEEKIKRQKKGKTERIVIQTAKDEKALLKEQKDFFQFLSKQKFSQEFRKPTNYEIADWIKKQAQNLGSEIAPQAIDALIGLLGDDMRQLKNEIEKLSAYKANTKEKLIQSEDVLELSRGRFDDNIFSLTDKISQANTGETVRILEEQIEGGISENYILTMAIRQFKIILRVKEALEKNPNSSQIASQLKLHPFVVQKSIAQSRNFTKEKLKQILNSLLEADLKTKTGQANLKTMLDLVFIN